MHHNFFIIIISTRQILNTTRETKPSSAGDFNAELVLLKKQPQTSYLDRPLKQTITMSGFKPILHGTIG